jgi:hypothetical protein
VCCAFSFCWLAWFAERPAAALARGEEVRRHARQARHRRVAARAAPGAGRADPWVVLERCWRAWSSGPPPGPAAQQERERLEARRLRAAELFAVAVHQAGVARQLGVSRQAVSLWYACW